MFLAYADVLVSLLFLCVPQVSLVAVAEGSQAVEEASRKKSRAGRQRSSEGLPAPCPGTVPRCFWVRSHLRIATPPKIFCSCSSARRNLPQSRSSETPRDLTWDSGVPPFPASKSAIGNGQKEKKNKKIHGEGLHSVPSPQGGSTI